MIECELYVDGTLTGEKYGFVALPRVGEGIRVNRYGTLCSYRVESIIHNAHGSLDHPEGVIKLRVSSQAFL